jgi:fructose-bisphosphate aldolase, class I
MKVSDKTSGQSGEQLDRMREGRGFVAAIDQSGPSTPRILAAYGIEANAYANEAEMFELVHRMRERIIPTPRFDAAKVPATIPFQDTLDGTIDGKETAEYVWREKGIVPIRKVDKGLEPDADGVVRMLKPIPGLDAVLDRARQVEVFGTEMRSFIKDADPVGIKVIVPQQFEVAGKILPTRLVPIIGPEIDIHSAAKAGAERLLLAGMVDRLASLPADQQVIVKLSPPEVDDFYADLVRHPRLLRVLALSSGFDRHEAIERLARQRGVIASSLGHSSKA